MINLTKIENRKIGKFQIEDAMIYDERYHDSVKAIMGSCVVLDAKKVDYDNYSLFEYLATSDQFLNCEDLNHIPYYHPNIETKYNDVCGVKQRRVDWKVEELG